MCNYVGEVCSDVYVHQWGMRHFLDYLTFLKNNERRNSTVET